MKKKTKLLIKDSFFSTILTCIIVALLAITFVNITFFNPIVKALEDFDFLDIYYSENFGNSEIVNTDIVLVSVEDKSRETIAEMLQDVIDNDPKVIGVDVIFKDFKDYYGDSLLSSVLQNDKIIMAYEYNNQNFIYSDSIFMNTNKPGYAEFNFDMEADVLREFQGISEADDGSIHYSFGAQVAKASLGNLWEDYKYDEKLKKINTIKYHGDFDSFQFMDASDLWVDYDKQEVFKDKIVLFGFFASSEKHMYNVEDKHWTPLNSKITGRSYPDMYGVVVHANIITMLINNDFMFRMPNFWLAILSIICMFFSTMYFIKINKKYKISYRTRKRTFLFIFTVILMGIGLFLFKKGIILRPFPIIVAAILAGSYFKYYKHLVRYIKTKRKWKSYIK